MPYVNLKDILAGSRENGYAVGAFNFNSYEDCQGMVDGAVAKNAPLILMASMAAVRYVGLKTMVYMVKGMAESVEIPVCLHLDHATDLDFIKSCIDAGFSSVMIDASMKTYEENIKSSHHIVQYAKQAGCSVEAELGMLGGREENIVVNSASACFTTPEDVPYFVRETGVDALAIAFGTAHGFYKETPKLDFQRVRDIAAVTTVPLVMHGGTGVSENDFRTAIVCGISKINVGTELKKTYVDAVREAVYANPTEEDPRKYMKIVKERCSQVVKEKIDIFGSTDKAR